MREFTFRPMVVADLPRVVRWQASEAAAPWFAGGLTLAQATERYGPRFEARHPIRMVVVHREGRDIGYGQAYRLGDLPGPAVPADPDAVGIDYVIGEPGLIGRGIGTRLIAALAEFALWLYPGAPAVVACPDHRNHASCRALEKAGFTAGLWFDAPSRLGGLPATEVVYTLPRGGSATRS